MTVKELEVIAVLAEAGNSLFIDDIELYSKLNKRQKDEKRAFQLVIEVFALEPTLVW